MGDDAGDGVDDGVAPAGENDAAKPEHLPPRERTARDFGLGERAEEIVNYFVEFRLGYYAKRKARLIADLTKQLETLNSKACFIDAVIKGRIVVANEKKPDLVKSIERETISKQDGGYDFLLSMPIWSLTYEKYAELQKKLDEVTKERERISKKTSDQFYRDDLRDLRAKIVA
jgi:DNA topoisomerase-2